MNFSVFFELSLGDLICTVNYMALELSIIYFIARPKTVSRMLFERITWRELLVTGLIGGAMAALTNLYFDKYLLWYMIAVGPQTSLLFGMLFSTGTGVATGLFSVLFDAWFGSAPSGYSIVTILLGIAGGLFRKKIGQPWYHLKKSLLFMFAAYLLTLLIFLPAGQFGEDMLDEAVFTLLFKIIINIWVLYVIAHLFRERLALEKKDLLTSELELAEQLQKKILPDFSSLDLPKQISVTGYLQPAKSVGGDWCDCLVNESSVDIVIGDVSGKGIPAALFMAASCVAFRTNLHSVYKTPAEAMQLANNSLQSSNSCFMFVTACCGKIDVVNKVFSYCAVGHPPFALLRYGRITFHPSSKGVLGLQPRIAPYDSVNIKLQPDDLLFFYTDGVTEAANKLSHQYGINRLSDCLGSVPCPSPHSLIAAVRSSIAAFVGEYPQSDDICMLAFQLLPQEADDAR